MMYTTRFRFTGTSAFFTEEGGDGSRLASQPAVRGVGTQLLAPGQGLVTTERRLSSNRPVWRLPWWKWSLRPDHRRQTCPPGTATLLLLGVRAGTGNAADRYTQTQGEAWRGPGSEYFRGAWSLW